MSLAVSGAVARGVQADVKLPAVFGDHMVLQRETEAPVWGWAAPMEAVSVRGDWMDAPAQVMADRDGLWRVRVKTPGAGGPHRVVVEGKNRIELSDVMVGEVWVCSGQSNMEFPLRAAENVGPAMDRAGRPGIRLFNVENAVAAGAKADCRGAWAVCGRESAAGFSAVGYFYAVRLSEALKVPVGMVEADWGGTPAEAWTSAEGLNGFPEFSRGLKEMAEIAAKGPQSDEEKTRETEMWRAGVGDNDLGMQSGWMKPDADFSIWQPLKVPGAWEGDLAGFDGVLWMRREVQIPEAWAGKDLVVEFGPIDDNDDTYFNGELVGKSWDEAAFSRARKYTVPGKLVKAGSNLIAVRVLDTGGPGGIMGTPEQQKIGPAGEVPISLGGEWRARIGEDISHVISRPASREVGPNMPSSLFNGMIAPIVGYGIRGAIWYQGEANVGRAGEYARLFPAMIGDWRRAWGEGEFPFYYVQIAPFNYQGDHGQAAELREAQTASLSTPNVGMAVTMDIGNPADIHPRDKVDVGERLARWALAKTYGRSDLEFSGPMCTGMKAEAGVVTLSFDHSAGLRAKSGTVEHFEVAGEDGKFAPATALIQGGDVVLTSDVAKPVEVRYCWGAGDLGTLENGAGLPAPSFRVRVGGASK